MGKQEAKALWAGVGLFTVLVVAGLLYMTGYISPQTAYQGAQAAPGSTIQTNQLPDCGEGEPVAQFATYYYDPNNNNLYTQVATTAYAYVAGSPLPATTVTTSATVMNTSTKGELSCGITYREIAGDGGGTTYYYARTADFMVDNAVMPLAGADHKGIEVIPSGAAVARVKASTTNYNTTMTYNWTSAGFDNSSTNSQDLYMQFQPPASPSMFGDLGYAVCFRYNSANFTNVRITGATSVNIAHVKATAALDTVQCSELPAHEAGISEEWPLYVKAASTGPSTGTTIDVVLVDKTNELFNGYLVPDENSVAGVLSNGYDTVNDPNTGTGRADVTTTSAFTVTR